MPSLENWDGGLKIFVASQLSPHIQAHVHVTGIMQSSETVKSKARHCVQQTVLVLKSEELELSWMGPTLTLTRDHYVSRLTDSPPVMCTVCVCCFPPTTWLYTVDPGLCGVQWAGDLAGHEDV